MPLPRRARFLAAALVIAVLILSVLIAWQSATPRDPILGTWTLTRRPAAFPGFTPRIYTFQENGHGYWTVPGHGGPGIFTWEPSPDPVYELTPRLLEIIGLEYPFRGRHITQAHLTEAHYRQAHAEDALQVSPARVYLICSTVSGTVHSSRIRFILEDGSLTPDDPHTRVLYTRRRTWLDDAWDRFRDLFP